LPGAQPSTHKGLLSEAKLFSVAEGWIGFPPPHFFNNFTDSNRKGATGRGCYHKEKEQHPLKRTAIVPQIFCCL